MMIAVRGFADLPEAVQAHIIETFKRHHAEGRLGPEKAIIEQGRGLAQEADYAWIPSRSWVCRLRKETLGIAKRPYGGQGYGPEVESIVTFMREQMGQCNEMTIKDYRTYVASFLAQGLNTTAAIEAARPTIVVGSNSYKKGAALTYMSRYYQLQAGEGHGMRMGKRPRTLGGRSTSTTQTVAQGAGTVMMEVETPPEEEALLPQHSGRGLEQQPMMGGEAARGGAAPAGGSGAAGGDEAGGPLVEEEAAAASAQQMNTVVDAVRSLLTYSQLDQLTFVAGVGCRFDPSFKKDRAMIHGYYCDVTPGRCGLPEQLQLVGFQRDEADRTYGRHEVALSLLKAAQPVLVRYGFRPRPGYDLFDQDQLIWLVGHSCNVTRVGTSATSAAFLAMFTRFMDCRMRPDTAVTGELPLAGTLMKIGSVNDKLRGAKAWGIKRMVVPKPNWAEVEEELKDDPAFEVLAADDVIELLNCCLEEGQEMPYEAAYRALRHVVFLGLRVREGTRIDTVECTAYPGTGTVVITGIEADDAYQPVVGPWTPPAFTYPRRNRAQSAVDVARLWLCKVQGQAWFEALPKGRRRFDLRRMVMWEDPTASDDDDEEEESEDEEEDVADGAEGDKQQQQTTTTEGERAQARDDDGSSGTSTATTSAAMDASPVRSVQTEPSQAEGGAGGSSSSTPTAESRTASPCTTTTGSSSSCGSSGPKDGTPAPCRETRADLYIHLPNSMDNADLGMAVVMALAQLMRSRLTPMMVSVMGEISPDGRLVPCPSLGQEVLTQTVVRKVITVQHQGDEGMSLPKVPDAVKLMGVSDMRDALQAAFHDDEEDEDEEDEGQQEEEEEEEITAGRGGATGGEGEKKTGEGEGGTGGGGRKRKRDRSEGQERRARAARLEEEEEEEMSV